MHGQNLYTLYIYNKHVLCYFVSLTVVYVDEIILIILISAEASNVLLFFVSCLKW